jgi:N-dimethylarginine dimethylaminohydrolase
MSNVHVNIDSLPQLDDISSRESSTDVLLVRPTYYDVIYEINPHMTGNIGNVNKVLALEQWNILYETYKKLGFQVHVIEGVPDLPDMVFCANQSFPYLDNNNQRQVILSKMASRYRQGEVEHIARWYDEHGYHLIHQTSPPVEFEGMGDALWHPNKKILYIGYGFRTSKKALERAAQCISCDVIGLELIQPHFYHLDTALSVINENTAIYVKEAFSKTGCEILSSMFENLIEVPLEEAKQGFVTNGHCPDERNFIVHKGNEVTKRKLSDIGIQVWEIDTSEFLKSGGSVFCMKMMLP